MGKRLLFLLLLSSLVNGCTTMHILDRSNWSDLKKIQSRAAHVRFLDGRQIEATNLTVGQDSTSFFDRNEGDQRL
jgi:hypothetical protein